MSIIVTVTLHVIQIKKIDGATAAAAAAAASTFYPS